MTSAPDPRPRTLAALAPLWLALAACVAPRAASSLTLYDDARIWLDASCPEPVEALLVEDGRVVAGGSAEDLALLARGTFRRVDLGGRVVVPGLYDAHGHLAGLGELLESVDLTGCASYEELVARVAERAARLPRGEWIVGRGWDQTRWPGGAFPHHAALSAGVPGHPVFLERVDGHAALVNARALELAGLAGTELPDVPGGRIHVGPDGRATGVLVDAATLLVSRLLPEPDAAALRRRLLAAQDALLAVGLVGVHDMGLTPPVLEALEELDADGRWKLRVVGYVWANEGVPAEVAAAHPSPDDRSPASRVRVVGAKLMLDGALGSRGAALLDDYADAPGERGLLLLGPEAYGARLDEALAAGLAPATHAIGDRANRLLLDAWEERLEREPELASVRARVEHAQVVAPEDLGRFERLGVVRSMQPTHATSDMRWAEARLGPERLRGAYAWRRLAEDPGRIALGSDFPVESPDPLEGLYAAVTRQDRDGRPPGGWLADQALTPREALAGFTTAAAYAAGEEGARGALRPGAFADFTVLDVDPLGDPPEALLGGHAWLVVIEGEPVYRRAR